MKKILISTTLFFFSAFVLRVQAQDDIQEIQDEWGKDKRELMQIGMELSKADSIKFWPIYDKYEKERQKLGRERILILDDYVKNYEHMTNAKADQVITRIIKNDDALNKLLQSYYPKFKTAMNAMQAAKFLHIESYLNNTIRAKLLESIPVIGPLESMKSN